MLIKYNINKGGASSETLHYRVDGSKSEPIYTIGQSSLVNYKSSSFNPYTNYFGFGFFSKKVVKIYELERRLKISRSTIISILTEAGFFVRDSGNTDLYDQHLQVLSKAFEKAIRQQFKKDKKSLLLYNKYELQSKVNFFKEFVLNADSLIDLEVFEQKLNSDLIASWFYKQATTDPDEINSHNTLYSNLRRLKFKLQTLYKDIRSQIFSRVISHHYYIFTSEEDHLRKAKIHNSFSYIFFNNVGKVIIKTNFIKLFQNGKNRNFNPTHTRIEFI
jgi:hypothetical protein